MQHLNKSLHFSNDLCQNNNDTSMLTFDKDLIGAETGYTRYLITVFSVQIILKTVTLLHIIAAT